ncbi:DUF3313 family protein [Pseudomonas sp. ZT5P21]
MKTAYQWRVSAVLCSLLIAGCTSKITDKEQFSGFLSSYEGLQQVASPSGHPVLRWVAPDFKPSAYDTVAKAAIGDTMRDLKTFLK